MQINQRNNLTRAWPISRLLVLLALRYILTLSSSQQCACEFTGMAGVLAPGPTLEASPPGVQPSKPVASSPSVSGATITPPGCSLGCPLPSRSEVERKYEEFKKSPYFVEPFEPHLRSVPQEQIDLVLKASVDDIDFYKKLLDEAIENRNKFAGGFRLIMKNGPKLLKNYIRLYRADRKLANRRDPKPAFFTMLADMTSAVAARSNVLKNNYSKKTINIDSFRSRALALFDYLENIVNKSPVSVYLKWDTLRLHLDNPKSLQYNVSMIDESSDLYAQFRVMGYEKSTFFVNRIVNLLRSFGRGEVPSSDSDSS